MDSKSKAQITRVCDAGLSAYLTQQRADYRLKSFSVGLVSGVLVCIPVYLLTNYYNLSSSLTVLPLFGGIVGGTYRGLTQSEMQDANYTVDFEEVCASVEPDEEEEEDESDGGDLADQE
jgi:hypothetical protein